MAAAMIDRLVHHGHLLIFEGKKYRKHMRKLERELYHLWKYVGQEGLWSEAKEYVEERKGMEISFEFIL